MGTGSAPRCPTPFAHGPMSPTKGCSSASGTPPRWQTLLNRLSSANPLASTPGAVGLFPGSVPPPGGLAAASANVSVVSGDSVARVATSCSHHPHSRLAPASLHRVALEASASIADGARHDPVSSPRPQRPCARAHLNPMFRTESPKTEVQTAIAMLQAAEEEKERARRRRRDERVAAKEAKRLAASGGGARGAAERAAKSRAEILARHRPARTDSLDSLDEMNPSRSSPSGSDASSSDDDAGGSDSGTSSISEPTETKSGAHRGRHRHRHRHHHHHHHHDTRSAAAKRRKTEEESKKRRRSHDDDDASEKHRESKHHKSGHHKSKHHKSKHHESKHHESKRHHRKSGHRHKSGRRKSDRDGDFAADATRARDRVDVNVRTKLDAGAERQERMEAECAGMRRVWSKTGLSETINRSCGNLVALIENAYGSFIGGSSRYEPSSSRYEPSPRPDSPIPA